MSELADKPRTNDKPKKSTQDMMDVGLFLTQLDIEDLNRADLNWLAKITRLAVVFARVGCTNPRKDSCGRAVTFLKQTMTVSELSDPGTFLSSVQDFKTALKAAVKKGAACNCARGEVHYTGCLARRVSDELVVGLPRPVRKSHESHKSVASSSSCQQQMQPMMMLLAV